MIYIQQSCPLSHPAFTWSSLLPLLRGGSRGLLHVCSCLPCLVAHALGLRYGQFTDSRRLMSCPSQRIRTPRASWRNKRTMASFHPSRSVQNNSIFLGAYCGRRHWVCRYVCTLCSGLGGSRLRFRGMLSVESLWGACERLWWPVAAAGALLVVWIAWWSPISVERCVGRAVARVGTSGLWLLFGGAARACQRCD